MPNQPPSQSNQQTPQNQPARQATAGEPMVTVKKADGTMMKVPLSQVRAMKKPVNTATAVGGVPPEGGKNTKTQKHENTENTSAISNQSSAVSTNKSQPQQPKSERRTLKAKPQTLAEGIEMMLAERKRIGQDSVIQTLKHENIKTLKHENTENKPAIRLQTSAPTFGRGPDQGVGAISSDLSKLQQPKSDSRKQKSNPTWAADDHKSLLDDEFHKENLPMVIEARQKALAKVRPVLPPVAYNLKSEAQKQKNTENKSAISLQTSAPTFGRGPDQGIGAIRLQKADLSADLSAKALATAEALAQAGVRPMMHDVQPPAPRSGKLILGPVDELHSFALADLRHLDVTLQAAGSKLRQKFETLKDESYLLYMEGMKAWWQSPLYRQYQDVLLRALTSRQTVSQILSASQEREAMKLEEWGAVVKVNQSLV